MIISQRTSVKLKLKIKCYQLRVIRDQVKSKVIDNQIIIPGDHIIIPEGTFAVLFGKNSFLQNLTALFSIISTYTIISDRVGN